MHNFNVLYVCLEELSEVCFVEKGYSRYSTKLRFAVTFAAAVLCCLETILLSIRSFPFGLLPLFSSLTKSCHALCAVIIVKTDVLKTPNNYKVNTNSPANGLP